MNQTQLVAIAADGDVQRQVMRGNGNWIGLVQARTIEVQRFRGPGTLEITQVKRWVLLRRARHDTCTQGEMDDAVRHLLQAGHADSRCLASVVEATMRCRRLSRSATLVARLASNSDT